MLLLAALPRVWEALASTMGIPSRRLGMRQLRITNYELSIYLIYLKNAVYGIEYFTKD
jgi:hypothetical protein